MAMDLVTGAVGSLISKLGELLKEEYNLQKGMPEKIRSIVKELECAKAALKNVAEVPPEQLNDDLVKAWAADVREASYDTFLVSSMGGHNQSDHGSLLQHLKEGMATVVIDTVKRRNIAAAIDGINKSLKEVAERRRRYTLENIMDKPSPKSTIDPRLEAVYKVRELFGVDEPCDKLKSMLWPKQRDDESQVKMLSVVGAGGLGKTTVVKELYDRLKGDSTVCTVSAFVPVGQKPNLKKVFRDILIDLNEDKYMDPKYNVLDEVQLGGELQKYIKDKRYFIVMDDVWETQSWERIKLALEDNNNGSRLIATTRIAVVADLAGVVYNLEPLPHHQSEKLFYTRIFGANGTCPDNQLREVGDKILKKCHGVLLAIITMASLLVGKTRGEWMEVCKSVFCVERNRQGNEQVSDTEWILSLSYYDMPLHLKTCLLYLSAFPEDYFISKNSLIRMWVAEGFVLRNERTGFFEVGEEYFNGLMNRNIIQEAKTVWDSNIVRRCRVHDMVLDLLRHISQQKNFLTISNNDGTISPSDKVLRVHRLAHQYRIVEPTHHDHHMDVLGNLRSLIACICDYEGVSLPRFKLLRVLALEGCKSREGFIHLEPLESLLHLRYLGLRGTHINDLPEGIGALKLLQTLDVSNTSIRELPLIIGQLTQLIFLDAGMVTVPNGVMEKLTSLEELQISVCKDTVGQFVRELRNLRELRLLTAELHVTQPDVQIDFLKPLGNLHKIQNVVLYGHIKDIIYQTPWNDLVLPQTLQCLILFGIEFPKMPSSCINPSRLPKLSILELHVEVLDEQGMKILAGFPELSYLYLSTLRASKLTIHAVDGCFQKLRTSSLPYSMVWFVANEDRSVSVIIGQDPHDVAVGTETRKDAPAVMPNLEMLEFHVHMNTRNA